MVDKVEVLFSLFHLRNREVVIPVFVVVSQKVFVPIGPPHFLFTHNTIVPFVVTNHHEHGNCTLIQDVINGCEPIFLTGYVTFLDIAQVDNELALRWDCSDLCPKFCCFLWRVRDIGNNTKLSKRWPIRWWKLKGGRNRCWRKRLG